MTFYRKVGNHWPKYTASHLERSSSYTKIWFLPDRKHSSTATHNATTNGSGDKFRLITRHHQASSLKGPSIKTLTAARHEISSFHKTGIYRLKITISPLQISAGQYLTGAEYLFIVRTLQTRLRANWLFGLTD